MSPSVRDVSEERNPPLRADDAGPAPDQAETAGILGERSIDSINRSRSLQSAIVRCRFRRRRSDP